MSADHVAVLAAAGAAALAAVVMVVVAVVLGRRTRELARALDDLRHETVPLVRDARVVVDQAATEMVRVGDVLESTEAVSATVDSASRLAYRAFANPVVKLLAYSTGVGSALRRLFGRRSGHDAGRTVRDNGHRPQDGARSSAHRRATPPAAPPAARRRRHVRVTP